MSGRLGVRRCGRWLGCEMDEERRTKDEGALFGGRVKWVPPAGGGGGGLSREVKKSFESAGRSGGGRF